MNLILTILSDIVFSLNLTKPLCFLALVVVLFLVSSPGAIATIIGVCTKLGIATHMKEQHDEEQAELAH